MRAKSLVVFVLCSFDCPDLAHTPAVYLYGTQNFRVEHLKHKFVVRK